MDGGCIPGKKPILVTGAAGFIGSHLCDFLLEKGESVIGIDNFLTGSRENIKHLRAEPNFSFIEHDITKPLKVGEHISQLYNLACPASPVDYQKLPIETLAVCSAGVKNMLELAVENSAAFLQASTSEVYGDPEQHPQREEYWGNVNPIGIRSCYDEGKRFAEALVMAYNRKLRADTRIVRIFNTYGPRMRRSDGRVVSNFIVQALEGKQLTVYGKGNQTRSFCYVSDMVKGLHAAMNSKEHMPINIGNPAESTILELAKIVKKLAGSKSEIIFKPLPADDPAKRKPDISKAKRILKWQPRIRLEEGLEKTVEYFRAAKQSQQQSKPQRPQIVL